jgi:hypothetical protein
MTAPVSIQSRTLLHDKECDVLPLGKDLVDQDPLPALIHSWNPLFMVKYRHWRESCTPGFGWLERSESLSPIYCGCSAKR